MPIKVDRILELPKEKKGKYYDGKEDTKLEKDKEI